MAVASSRPALLALLMVNLIPLAGVLLFGWRLFDIMALYWLENGIIGLYNVLKMLLSRGGALGSVNKAFTIPFFIVHYGLFWAVHGIFVFLLFSEGSLFSSGLSFRTGFDPFAMPEIALRLVTTSGALAVAALSLVLSHGVSFAANFVGRGEYRRLGLQQLMSQPYGRVMILHVTLIFGGFAIMVLGEPLLALVLMIGIKIAVDASAHVREHRDRGGERPDGS